MTEQSTSASRRSIADVEGVLEKTLALPDFRVRPHPARFTVRQTLALERGRHGSPCTPHADVTTSDQFAVIEWGMH
jgi:hypothetical protein